MLKQKPWITLMKSIKIKQHFKHLQNHVFGRSAIFWQYHTGSLLRSASRLNAISVSSCSLIDRSRPFPLLAPLIGIGDIPTLSVLPFTYALLSLVGWLVKRVDACYLVVWDSSSKSGIKISKTLVVRFSVNVHVPFVVHGCSMSIKRVDFFCSCSKLILVILE